MLRDDPDSVFKSEENIIFCCQSLLRIVSEDQGKIVPLIPNATQRLIIRAYVDARAAGKPVRIIILKGRQQGSSTIICAIYMLEMWAYSNMSVLVATEKKGQSASNIFEKYVLFSRSNPIACDIPAKDLFRSYADGNKFVLHNSSRLRSEGQSEITSFTDNLMHISEAAFFHDFEKFLEDCLQSISELPSTSIFIESTAKQYNDGFHSCFNRAQSDGGFQPIFAPWHLHENNSKPIPKNEREDIIASFGNEAKAFGNERSIQSQYNLSPEQMFWRRERIVVSCGGRIETFGRLYPANPSEAFLASSRPVLDSPSLDYMMSRCKEPKMVGSMIPNIIAARRADGTEDAEFAENSSGAIEIWEEPIPYQEYVAGSDHAEGMPSGDFNAGLIALRNPFRIVAKIHGDDHSKLESQEFSEQWYYLLRWYNESHILGEANHQSGGTVLRTLELWEYPNVMFEFEIFPESTSKRIGWLSSKSSRKEGVDLLIDALKLGFENEKAVLRSEWTPQIPDSETISECMHLVWSTRGKAEAKKKGQHRSAGEPSVGFHDDLVFAMVGLLFAQRALPDPKSESVMKLDAHGPDHFLTQDLEDHLRAPYLESEKTYGADDWMSQI